MNHMCDPSEHFRKEPVPVGYCLNDRRAVEKKFNLCGYNPLDDNNNIAYWAGVEHVKIHPDHWHIWHNQFFFKKAYT